MEKVNYANIAKELLGDGLYYEFIKEISKEHGDANLVDFGKEVLNKICFFTIILGMSNKIKMDNIKICFGEKVVEKNNKKIIKKYKRYSNKIKENVLNITKEAQKK